MDVIALAIDNNASCAGGLWTLAVGGLIKIGNCRQILRLLKSPTITQLSLLIGCGLHDHVAPQSPANLA